MLPTMDLPAFMDRSYTFSLARQDIMSSVDAPNFDEPEPAPIRNALLTLIGFMLAFIGGVDLLVFGKLPDEWSRRLDVAAGAAIMFAFGAVPVARFVHRRWQGARPWRLTIDDTGVHATTHAASAITHKWNSLESVTSPHGAVLLSCANHTIYRIPRSAFASMAEREEFVAFARSRLITK